MKAIVLLNDFLTRAIAASFLCWLASLHPALLNFVRAIGIIFALLWVMSWLLDDWLTVQLKITHNTLQAMLVGSLAAALIGLGVIVCRS